MNSKILVLKGSNISVQQPSNLLNMTLSPHKTKAELQAECTQVIYKIICGAKDDYDLIL
jgi:hypothetical protein